MNMRVIVLVVFALGASLGTVLLARSWMSAQRATPAETVAVTPEPAATQVVVAAQDLPTGTFLKPGDLRWQAWPGGNLAASYAVKGEHKLDEFVGSVVRDGIATGQPITAGRVVKPGERGFLAAVLEPGTRAISVSVDATTGIAGFVFPGDRVDLILTHRINEEDEMGSKIVRRGSETVLTNLRVLAIDQNTNDQEGKPAVAKNATLEVTPKQAEIIAVASDLGRLSLSLRSLAPVGGTAANATLVAQRQRSYTWDSDASLLIKPPNSALGSRTVNVVRGDKAETQKFSR